VKGAKPSPPPGPPPDHYPAVWASDWGEDPWGLWQAFTYKRIRQGFRWIPPTPRPFLMGSPESEHGRHQAERQHPVLLTRGYWMAETACTQALWQAVTGGSPSRFKGERRPVESVSWEDVQGFLGRLNAELEAFAALVLAPSAAAARGTRNPAPGLTSDALAEPAGCLRLRLPTEAEWEYACRAGTAGPFAFGDDIDPETANYDGTYPYRGKGKGLSRQETVEVASLPPTTWGLYEVHGNVWEWCKDWYGEYPSEAVTDPLGPPSGERRVLRGGSWVDGAHRLRSACRGRNDPGLRDHFNGFRLALGPELTPAGHAGREPGRAVRARSAR